MSAGSSGGPDRLIRSATVARGTVWNIIGRVGPLFVALAATPFLIDALGLVRWGVFALALSLVGLFSGLDLGLGRALTRLVADRLGAGEGGRAADAVATGLVLLAGLGLVATVIAGAGVYSYTTLALDLPEAMRREVVLALWMLCLAAPLTMLNAALWGVLAAHQRFAAANLVNLPILALYYLGPLAVLRIWDSLVAAMAVLVVCRAMMTLAYWRLCLDAMPALRGGRFDRAAAGQLARQGGWMTVSTLLWPVVLHVDRFIIAARLSAVAAAHYATPFDLVIRLAVLSQAVVGSAFPAIATALRADPGAVGRLFRHSQLAIAAMLLPTCLVCALFAEALLTAWLGAEFAAAAAAPMRWLALGVLVHALDGVTTALIDGAGRAEQNALVAAVELAVYLPALFLLLDGFGIAGAAMAWSLRAVASGGARMVLAARLLGAVRAELRRLLPVWLAAVLAMVVAIALGSDLLGTGTVGLGWRICGLVLLPLPALGLGWGYGLMSGERAALRGLARWRAVR